MRALSLTQPWAMLVAVGAKKIETRSWGLSCRLPITIAIHAAKGLAGMSEAEYRALARSQPHFGPALRAGGYPMAGVKHFDDLPRGAIIAVCDVMATCPTTALSDDGFFSGPRSIEEGSMVRLWKLTDQERAFGDYSDGRFAWLLSNIRALPEPVPAKGALGLWAMDEATEVAVRLQLPPHGREGT